MESLHGVERRLWTGSMAFVLVALVSSGCREARVQGVQADPPPAFEVTVQASDTVLERGDSIDLTVQIANVGTREGVWGRGSSGCRFKAHVLLDGEFVEVGPPRVCTMDMREYRLDVGETYVAVLRMDGTVLRNGEIEELPAGEVEVFCGHEPWMSAPVRVTIVD